MPHDGCPRWLRAWDMAADHRNATSVPAGGAQALAPGPPCPVCRRLDSCSVSPQDAVTHLKTADQAVMVEK